MQIISNPVITVTRSSKRKLNELLKLFDDTTSSQRPDGVIEDTTLKHINMIEVARTDDSPNSLLQAHVNKKRTYNLFLHALRKAFPQYVVKQQNYVIGRQGSIKKQQWRQQLTELRVNLHQREKTIQKCIAASIRGTHAVASSSEKQGNDVTEVVTKTPGHRVKTSIYIHILYILCDISHM